MRQGISAEMTGEGGGARPSTLLRRRLAWVALFDVVLLAVAAVGLPVWLIQPFAAQTERGLRVSYLLRSWSPILTLAASVLCLILAVWLWRGARWWKKPLLAAALVVCLGATWFARQNYFEWMFNPLSGARYAAATEVDFLTHEQMVLAVALGGEAVAYPVTQLAYHHLVHDTVGGVPLVATY